LVSAAVPVGLPTTVAALAVQLTAGITTTTTIGTLTILAMTTLQKTIFSAALIGAIGTSFYQAREAASLRSTVRSFQQRSPGENGLEKSAQDSTIERQLSNLRHENDRLNENTVELMRLRAEVARLKREAPMQAAPGIVEGPMESTLKGLLMRVSQVKQRFEQAPETDIPELKLLNEEDWLGAVRGQPLENDEDYRRALSSVRHAAENKFASTLQPAIVKFAEANNGMGLTNTSQLQPYFETPIAEKLLQRWGAFPADFVSNVKLGGDWIVTQNAPVDAEFDQRVIIGPSGGRGGTSYFGKR
jgi:hypothetical protein